MNKDFFKMQWLVEKHHSNINTTFFNCKIEIWPLDHSRKKKKRFKISGIEAQIFTL